MRVPGAREAAKRLFELALVGSGIPRRRIARDASAVAVLAYHNVVPSGETIVGDHGAHIHQARFAAQLDAVAETHDFVGLAEALDPEVPAGDRPRAVVTFDDAYTGAVHAGFDELRRRSIPATVFVPPGLLGTEGFWWDQVAVRPDEPLDYRIRQFALDHLEGRQERVVRWASEEGLLIRDVPEHARPADAATIVCAASESAVTLAPHSWGHPNLSALSTADVRDEIVRSRAWVADQEVPWVDWFAYPYGLATAPALQAVQANMKGGVLAEGGLARADGEWRAEPNRVPRILVPSGLTVRGLLLRLAQLVEA